MLFFCNCAQANNQAYRHHIQIPAHVGATRNITSTNQVEISKSKLLWYKESFLGTLKSYETTHTTEQNCHMASYRQSKINSSHHCGPVLHRTHTADVLLCKRSTETRMHASRMRTDRCNGRHYKSVSTGGIRL